MQHTKHATNKRRPVIIDLFCGAGGSAMGLWQAGFQPVGIDINPRALLRYPFPKGVADIANLTPRDVLAGVSTILNLTEREARKRIGAGWASPPCQLYSGTRRLHERDEGGNRPTHLIPLARWLLTELSKLLGGIPWIIENVEEAAPHLRAPIRLCGSSAPFGFVLGGIVCLRPRKTSTSEAPAAITPGSSTSPCMRRRTAGEPSCPPRRYRCTARTATECGTSGRHINWISQELISQGWPWESTGCPRGTWRRPSRRLSAPSLANSC